MANGARIPTSYARQLAKNYKEQKLGRPLLIDDTRAVWFSKDVLLDALGMGDNPIPNISGIRFYFGAYENRDVFPKNPDYRRMVTLVMVQTQINPVDSRFHKDMLADPGAEPAYPDPATFTEFNDGQICPPPNCDSDGLLRNV